MTLYCCHSPVGHPGPCKFGPPVAGLHYHPTPPAPSTTRLTSPDRPVQSYEQEHAWCSPYEKEHAEGCTPPPAPEQDEAAVEALVEALVEEHSPMTTVHDRIECSACNHDAEGYTDHLLRLIRAAPQHDEAAVEDVRSTQEWATVDAECRDAARRLRDGLTVYGPTRATGDEAARLVQRYREAVERRAALDRGAVPGYSRTGTGPAADEVVVKREDVRLLVSEYEGEWGDHIPSHSSNIDDAAIRLRADLDGTR